MNTVLFFISIIVSIAVFYLSYKNVSENSSDRFKRMLPLGLSCGVILLCILGLLAVFLLFSFIRHRVLLEGEKDLLTPPGQMVDVDGHKMHVFEWWGGEYHPLEDLIAEMDEVKRNRK